MAYGCHVLRSVAGAEPAEILLEYDVEHPVRAVLDMPVASDRVGEQFSVEWHGREIVAPFAADIAVVTGGMKLTQSAV